VLVDQLSPLGGAPERRTLRAYEEQPVVGVLREPPEVSSHAQLTITDYA
jgi:hypothetical protein